MSRREEFVGVRVIDHVTDDGPCYSQWLTDEPIVRCRDCKLSYTTDLSALYHDHEHDTLICMRAGACVTGNEDGFCAWGERRDG